MSKTPRFSLTNMFRSKVENRVTSEQPQILVNSINNPKRAVALGRLKKLTLPVSFAQEILDYDIQFETQAKPDLQVAQKLTSLYMLGVEYHSSIQDLVKLQYFQDKLAVLMQSSKVFESQSQQLIPSNLLDIQYTAKSKRAIHLKGKQTESIKEIISTMKDTAHQIDSLVKNDITSQIDLLQKRLAQRRNTSIAREMFKAASHSVIDKLKQNPTSKDSIQEIGYNKENLDRFLSGTRSIRVKKRNNRSVFESDYLNIQNELKKTTRSSSAPNDVMIH